MTPDQDLSAPKRWNMYVSMPTIAEKTKWTHLEIEECGDWVLYVDHERAVQAAVAKAVEAERELFLQMVADRRALYGAKAKRHEGDIEDTCSEWEKIQHTITSYDYFAAAIRSRGVKG